MKLSEVFSGNSEDLFPTPFLDACVRVGGPEHLLLGEFPVIVDANVPDPATIYVSRGYELSFEVNRVVLTHRLEAVMKLEAV